MTVVTHAAEPCTPLQHRCGVVYVVMHGNARLGVYECVCEGYNYARFLPYDGAGEGRLDDNGYLRVVHSDELASYAVHAGAGHTGTRLVPVTLFATELSSKHAF